MGMAGIAAVGNGSVAPFQYPQVAAALFALAGDVFPLWLHFLMLICALMLAMSTLDTMMNGLASNIAADMGTMRVSRGTLMLVARAATIVVAIPAIIVSTQANSVLYVFLVADLIGAAIAVPMLTGLYSRRMPGWAVLLAGGAGVVIGALYYPRPDLVSPWALAAPVGQQMLFAFGSALVVSAAITAAVVWGRRLLAPAQQFDFAILNSDVRLIDETAAAR